MIQIAQNTDIDDIYNLIESSIPHVISRTKEDIAKNIYKFIVIKKENKVVACASFEEYDDRIAEIRSMVVDSGYRGNGYSEMLINKLKTRAKRNQKVMVVTNKVALFEKYGFASQHESKQILFLKR
ncbi:MAG: GNAT family N-acetyltransferase [Candidatus Roizmanbacteria bacterium]